MKGKSSYRTASNWFDLTLKLAMGTFASGVGVNSMFELLSFLDIPNAKSLHHIFFSEYRSYYWKAPEETSNYINGGRN